jgi:hypothetical protein
MKKLFVLTPGKSALFAFGLFSAAAVSEGPALAGKEGYHFSEVRSHQFVEAWPSLNSDEKSIHIKVKVSNGVQIAPFSPTARCWAFTPRPSRARWPALKKMMTHPAAPEGDVELYCACRLFGAMAAC